MLKYQFAVCCQLNRLTFNKGTIHVLTNTVSLKARTAATGGPVDPGQGTSYVVEVHWLRFCCVDPWWRTFAVFRGELKLLPHNDQIHCHLVVWGSHTYGHMGLRKEWLTRGQPGCKTHRHIPVPPGRQLPSHTFKKTFPLDKHFAFVGFVPNRITSKNSANN